MLSPPTPAEQTENARAAVTADMQQILEDTERDVGAELDRLEAAKRWALAEMDRSTERAKKDIDAGKDSEEVMRRLEAELAATMAKAGDPEFDPRTSTSVTASEQSPAVPAAVPTPPIPSAAPPSTAAHEAESAAPVVEVRAPVPSATSACACSHSRGEGRLAAWLLVLALARRRI
jgi:hypothetical protein